MKNPNGTGGNPRITPRVQACIEAIVYGGRTIPEAAIIGGIKPLSLRAALRKPHVRAYRAALTQTHVQAEGERSLYVLTQLRDHAASEHVRLEAAKHLMALAGLQPRRQAETLRITVGPTLHLEDHSASEPIEATWEAIEGPQPGGEDEQ